MMSGAEMAAAEAVRNLRRVIEWGDFMKEMILGYVATM